MIRLLLIALATLFIAAIVHIVVVLQVPSFSARDMTAEIGTLAPELRMTLLPRPAPDTPFPHLPDPNMVFGVCRFSLETGPVRVRADLGSGNWSVSLLTRAGLIFYSLNNRASIRRDLDLIVLDIDQSNHVRQTPFPDQDQLLLVQSPEQIGFALIRALVESESQRPEIESLMERGECQTVELPEPEPDPVGPQVPPRRPDDE